MNFDLEDWFLLERIKTMIYFSQNHKDLPRALWCMPYLYNAAAMMIENMSFRQQIKRCSIKLTPCVVEGNLSASFDIVLGMSIHGEQKIHRSLTFAENKNSVDVNTLYGLLVNGCDAVGDKDHLGATILYDGEGQAISQALEADYTRLRINLIKGCFPYGRPFWHSLGNVALWAFPQEYTWVKAITLMRSTIGAELFLLNDQENAVRSAKKASVILGEPIHVIFQEDDQFKIFTTLPGEEYQKLGVHFTSADEAPTKQGYVMCKSLIVSLDGSW